MENLKQRIELLISTKGMTNAVFAEKIGVQPSNISHVLSGRNKPSLDLVTKILKCFKEVRTEWLLNGSGSMTKAYNLFEMEGEDIPEETKLESENVEPERVLGAKQEKILEAFEPKMEESKPQQVEKKEDKIKPEVEPEVSRKVENINPHKSQAKSIERIVVFYEDRTFKEYYPEN